MYVAVKYIGTDFTPGEVLPDDLDRALVKRLLKSGAIREIAPDSAAIPASKSSQEMTREEEVEMVRKNYEEMLFNLGYAPDGTPLPPDEMMLQPETQNTDEEIKTGEDPDNEQEPPPPEVDAAAALVQEDDGQKPKANRGKKGGKA